MMTDECWLLLPHRPKRRVTGRGLMVGRSLHADVHLPEAKASRRHALIYLDLEGPLLVPLGRRPVRVNGQIAPEPRRLRDGDTLSFPGLECQIQHKPHARGELSGWVLGFHPRPGHTASVPPLTHLPPEGLTAGGGRDDDLHLPDWPANAVRILPDAGSGWRALLARGLLRSSDQPPDTDGSIPLCSGDRLLYNGETLQLLDPSACARTTMAEPLEDLPLRVELRPLAPAGGQITLLLRSGEFTAFVPGVRFDLLQVLLRPPGGLSPGSPLPDATVLPLVWGRHPPLDRKAVTTQAQRLRRDLDKAGMDGSALVLREHGRTRFALADGAQVEILAPR